ncbi:MAG: heavy-metal-associated domain-containing protein [Prevotella sp.]|nr:heavy-metal-associated domain-containing protein [Prevotella sp.]
METKIFAVSGMKCEHCKAHVEEALKALEGVEAAEASVGGQNVVVTYDEASVTPDQLKQAVDQSGRYRLTL